TVACSAGAYRTTLHPYKLVFQMKTRVELSECPEISRFGLSLSTIAEIRALPAEYDHLVDVVGLLTGVSREREYLRDSRVTKMIVIELTDHTGKCECALFGDYVGQFLEMVGKKTDYMPVVIVQFAKVKLFRDEVSIQNVINTTRLLVDPPIAEAVGFKDRLASHGINAATSIVVLGPRVRPSMEEDFLHSYPIITISGLNSLTSDGVFVVSATIIGVVADEDWWYPACKCHKSVSPDSSAYYCGRCVKHVFQMIPRFRVKLRVTDGGGDGVFVVFDGDMQYLLGDQCATLVARAAVIFTPLDQRAKPVIIDPALYSVNKSDVFWVTERRSVPTAYKLFTGSVWMMLSHQFVEYILWGWDNLPRIVLMYYANFLSSPEGYFHTVICNAEEFRNTTVNHDLHFISWDNPPKQHPHYLTAEHYQSMVESNAPFGRKFGRNEPLLDKIDT
ncbi:xylosyltransferase 1-like protein, partial [Trifolium pratense]